MKTLDHVIADLIALRDQHGGNVRVALGDEGDGLLRGVESAEYQAEANLDYEGGDRGEYVHAPAIAILSKDTMLSVIPRPR